MSAHMKKHPTSKVKSSSRILYVVDENNVYAIPESIAKKYTLDTKPAISRPDNVSADNVFAELDSKTSKAASLLRGLRSRENLSQVEFAKRIDVTQSNLSKMENGSRPIGKTIAKRIAKEFDTNYKHFIE